MKAVATSLDPTPKHEIWKLFFLVGDLTAQRVLCHLCSAPHSVHQLVVQLNLPQTTVYKKLHELEAVGAIVPHHRELSACGRGVTFFESRVLGLHVQEQDGIVEFRVKWRSGTEEVRTAPMSRLSAVSSLPVRTPFDCDHPDAAGSLGPSAVPAPSAGTEEAELTLDTPTEPLSASAAVRGPQGTPTSRQSRSIRRRPAFRPTKGASAASTEQDGGPIVGAPSRDAPPKDRNPSEP